MFEGFPEWEGLNGDSDDEAQADPAVQVEDEYPPIPDPDFRLPASAQPVRHCLMARFSVMCHNLDLNALAYQTRHAEYNPRKHCALTLRVFVQPWKCLACPQTNALHHASCKGCGVARPPEQAQKWRCNSCGEHGAADHKRCSRCGKAKPMEKVPCVTALVRQCGRVLVSGTCSEEDLEKASRTIAKLIKKGQPDKAIGFKNFRIAGSVCTATLDFPIRIDDMAAKYRRTCTYEPEYYSGCHMRVRMDEGESEGATENKLASLLVTVGGKVTIPGQRTIRDAARVLKRVYHVLHSFRGPTPAEMRAAVEEAVQKRKEEDPGKLSQVTIANVAAEAASLAGAALGAQAKKPRLEPQTLVS